MRRTLFATMVTMAWVVLVGCTPSIELVGYGQPAPIQHGLELRLISTGPAGAVIHARNTTDDLLSIITSRLAMKIEVRRAGHVVAPSSRIMLDLPTGPGADDFAIIAPGQTRAIPVPVSFAADELRTPTGIYTIAQGPLYEIEVRIEPSYGGLTEANAGETLARFKIPNFVRGTLQVNTMTIRAR